MKLVNKLMPITINTTTSRPPVPFMLQILTKFNLYSGGPGMGLSVNNKQKVRQTVVKISRGGGGGGDGKHSTPPPRPWSDMF